METSNRELKDGEKIYVKHHTYYFEDGNIILLISNNAFRLFRSILARRSEIFRDMFNLEPCAQRRTIQGVPAVTLDDHPDDFAEFLAYVLPQQPVIEALAQKSLSAVFSLLSFAGKYAIVDINNFVLEELDRRLPWNPETISRLNVYNSYDDAANTINVCRAYCLPKYLPLAFLSLALGDSVATAWGPILRLHFGGSKLKVTVQDLVNDVQVVNLCGSAFCEIRRNQAVVWLQRHHHQRRGLFSTIPDHVFEDILYQGDTIPLCPKRLGSRCEQVICRAYEVGFRRLYDWLDDTVFMLSGDGLANFEEFLNLHVPT